MGIFSQPKPRRFHHEMMFSDEHADRVERIRRQAEDEMGKAPEPEFSPDDIRGAFTASASHLRRRKYRQQMGRHWLSTGVAVLAIFVLVVLWLWLLGL